MSLSVLHFVTYVRENMSTMAVSMPLVEHHDVDYHFVVEEKVGIDNVLVATRRRGQTQPSSCYGLEDIRSISRGVGFVTLFAADEKLVCKAHVGSDVGRTFLPGPQRLQRRLSRARAARAVSGRLVAVCVSSR